MSELISPSRPVTKRRYIYEVLRERIRSGALPAESRVDSAETLAKEFGVSYLTVHAALRDLVQDGFLVRHQGRGTFVAWLPEVKRSSSSIVAVTPIENDIIASNNSAQVLSILRGCSLGAQQHAGMLSMLTLPTVLKREEINLYLPEIRKHGGAVFIGYQYHELMERLSEERFPACAIDADKQPSISHITFDRPQAVSMAVQHLIKQGHRRIGFFGSINSHGGAKRKAYVKTLQRAGITYERGWAVDHHRAANTYQLIKKYLATQKLDAVFLDNYNNARFFITVARECGMRIPEDLAIMAYGIASPSPYDNNILSHVSIPYEAMGREAVDVVNQIIRGDIMPPVTKCLPVSLQVHQSCSFAVKSNLL